MRPTNNSGCTDAENRNLFIIEGCPVLAYPKAKHWWRTHQASLWALPHEVAVPIYLLLGILRPVKIQIIHHLRARVCPQMQTHFFVQTIDRRHQ
jgi:hypothetical protein